MQKVAWKSSKGKKYTIAESIAIKNAKLVIKPNVTRTTASDEYYESWGLDCNRESAKAKHVYAIKFCPFYGKPLEQTYKPRYFVYINNSTKAEEWVLQQDSNLQKKNLTCGDQDFIVIQQIGIS